MATHESSSVTQVRRPTDAHTTVRQINRPTPGAVVDGVQVLKTLNVEENSAATVTTQLVQRPGNRVEARNAPRPVDRHGRLVEQVAELLNAHAVEHEPTTVDEVIALVNDLRVRVDRNYMAQVRLAAALGVDIDAEPDAVTMPPPPEEGSG